MKRKSPKSCFLPVETVVSSRDHVYIARHNAGWKCTMEPEENWYSPDGISALEWHCHYGFPFPEDERAYKDFLAGELYSQLKEDLNSKSF